MPVNPGARLGPYEITAPIGAGGMGEVFRARDTKLGREVAIKVLPAAFAQDPERLARFEREARLLASLNHTNIAHVYGFESGALPDGSTVHFLAMEMVEGEDLAERLKRGAIPTDEAIAMARQIAEGLEEAHDRGIIHRDLKPANVKLTPDGKVKVLDFGLAKAIEGEPGAGAAGSQLSHSPTISRHMTEAGVIMGTAAYMSPEQAKGKAVDKRADIWAFGVLLFEMLTGERLFAGESVAETLGLIFSREPDLAKLSAETPPRVRALIARCLVKDPRRRLRDIGEARLALEGGPDAPSAPERKPRRAGSWIWPAIAAAALTMAALSLWNRPIVDRTQTRFSIPLPKGQELTSYPAITRDGRTLAWVAQESGGDSQLYLRDLNAFEARPVSGARGAKQPFFSPDGRWVAFFAQGQLQKAEVAGGAPIRLADAAYSFGGTWNEDDTIIYTTSLGSGLWRIPASGGTPESLTVPDGAANGYAHVYPQALPGGRRLLFTAWGQKQGAAVLSLDSRKWDLVLPEGSFGAAVFDPGEGASPRLLMIDQAGGMRAAAFDPRNPARTSAEGSVLSDVYSQVETDTLGWLAVSNTGAAVYATGNPAKTSLVWVDREGRVDPLRAEQDAYREVNLSPDGTAAVVRHRLSLWTHDLARGTRSPLTSGNSNNNLALWSRDGRRIIFGSTRGGDWDIYTQPADGSGPAEILVKRPFDQFPYSILPDGTLLFVEIHPRTGRDLWTASPDGKVSPLRITPSNEFNAHFSPGPMGAPRLVAYSSDESGRSEIYVQSFPGGERRVPVSTSGGILPAWSPDGKELFYVTGEAMMAAAMRPDGSVGASRRLFDRSRFLFNDRFRSYAVSPDGKRFLMIRRDPGSIPTQLNVILNWTAESKQTATRGGGN